MYQSCFISLVTKPLISSNSSFRVSPFATYLASRLFMPDVSTPAQQPLYTIGKTKAGFLGAFARVPIKKGTVVLCEQPLFVVDAPLQAYLFQRAAGGNGPTPVQGEEEDETEAATLEEFLDRGIRRTLRLKTEGQRERFWQLANTHDELPPAFGIFTTNAVS
jgi:hypothetical protein